MDSSLAFYKFPRLKSHMVSPIGVDVFHFRNLSLGKLFSDSIVRQVKAAGTITVTFNLEMCS